MANSYDTSPAIQALSLGKKSDYISHYTPELLQAVPRQLNRDELNLDSEQGLPFEGYDLWNLYELSWLNAKGKPQVAVASVSLPCEAPNLVESKSFKLYLNSFNQTKVASVSELEQTLSKDLSACAGGPVSVNIHAIDTQFDTSPMPGECIDELDIEVDNFAFNPDLLDGAVTASEVVTETLHSHLLKSNCLVTNQPDWGSILIHYQGQQINREALLRYLISFRQHNEFHEQCVERVFCDIMRFCAPEKLTVYARYTRRGGLDINPMRSNDPDFVTQLGNWRLLRQ